VFTFGSPPIFEIELMPRMRKMTLEGGGTSCSILDAFDLPTDIVYSYYQPLDPIARLYSQYDPLYPLIDDLGEDGYTPWVSGKQNLIFRIGHSTPSYSRGEMTILRNQLYLYGMTLKV
jgi:hypothetical protein